jgi:hypothetical protein
MGGGKQGLEGQGESYVKSHAKAATAGSTGTDAPSRPRRGVVLAALLGCLAGLCLLVSVASGEDLPILYRSFGPHGSSASNFREVTSTAVDQQTHDVYVLDRGANALYKFDEEGHALDWGGSANYISGNKIEGLSTGEFVISNQVAVDSQTHVVYVTSANAVRAFAANGDAADFSAGPGAGTSEITGFSELFGVAVDANGDIYAADRGADRVSIYSPAGEPITQFSAEGPRNMAVAPDGGVYVVERFGSVRKFSPSSFPVESSTTYTPASNPIAQGDNVAVDPANGNVFLIRFAAAGGLQIAEYDASGAFFGAFAGRGEEGELGSGSRGLAVGANHKVYVGSNGEFQGTRTSKVEIFGPFPVLRPTVESSSALEVSADFARLRARINPNTLETTYHFEFGLSDCSATPDPCAEVAPADPDIGSGHSGVWVYAQLPPLQAATTYHYRVVAENELGVTTGPDRTFTTQPRGLGASLSDSRAWEMVSPPNKHGAILLNSIAEGGLIQAAADGRALAYISKGSVEGTPEGNRSIELSTILARRTEAGWQSTDITPPNARAHGYSGFSPDAYNLFSPNLERAELIPADDTVLASGLEELEFVPFLRENSSPPVYTPLLTTSNVPPGTRITESNGGGVGVVRLSAANPSLDHLVLSSQYSLVGSASERGGERTSLYMWFGGHLQPVSVMPVAEGGEIVEAVTGSNAGSGRNAVSVDGSRVFWSAGFASLSALYLRDTVTEETVRLDVPQPGVTGGGESRPIFQGASAEGTVVFFTDSQRLTEDASPEGRDLYRCEIPSGDSAQGCASLTDITAPAPESEESAEVPGIAAGMSQDGSHIYFVAKDVLDESPNEAGDTAAGAEPNLYLWQRGGGVRFIATLSKEEANDWGGSSEGTFELSTASSPSGRYLVFMSHRGLTADDILDVTTGEGDEEVFRYDAAGDALACVSCNPTGAAPSGSLVNSPLESAAPLVDPQSQYENSGHDAAAILPEPSVVFLSGPSLYRPRAVLDNGRVFFNAIDSLVSADSNANWDVYEYEPSGLGSCTASSAGPMVNRSGEGCVSLISSGSAEEEAAFLDASESGGDVFFLSSARLSVTDVDSELDVYDARVNGTPAVLHPITECAGESCQAATIAPNDPTPASEAFSGAGNPSACARVASHARRHGSTHCARKRHHKHKHAKKHRRRGSARKGRGAK